MDFDFTPEQEQLREDYRRRLGEVMTPERRQAVSGRLEGGSAVTECRRALGDAGLLGVAWPTRYGGSGLTALEQYIFAEEASRAEAPLPFITLNTVGPTLIQFGTDKQKHRFLPAILRGAVDFAIGYSEAGAGSDLASLRTSAVRDGDEFVINGSKLFTSGAEFADYIWLAARTDPTAKMHEGITVFIVPTAAAGFSWKPLNTMPGVSTYYTFYDDVRVPASSIVLGENEGWRVITNQLNLERAAMGNLGALEFLFHKTLQWASATGFDEGMVIDQPWAQQALARVEAKVAAYKLLNLRLNTVIGAGALNMGEASAAKVFGSELTQQVTRELLEIVGHNGTRVGATAPLRGALEHAYRLAVINTFGGGANEIQRDIIAVAGLGMPREPRNIQTTAK